MENILVTGGAGYIGSHACLALAEAGYNPVTFDNLSTGWQDAVQFGPFVQGDLNSYADVAAAFEKYTPSGVMHFAAFSDVGEASRNPAKYWQNNVNGSLNLLRAVAEYNVQNFIFSSTCATYGDQDNVLLDETARQTPTNAYGGSKLAVEHMLRDYADRFGFSYVIFRYFNVAGADDQARIGENHDPETHLIPLAIKSAQGNRPPLTIFGSDYDTPDGTCIRDYVHVCDLVDAHVAGLSYLEQGQPSRVFNLGTGHGFSVREVIEAVGKSTSIAVPTEEGARRPGDSTCLVSGSSDAQKVLNWSAKRSTLPTMISDAWKWHSGPGYRK